MSKEEADRAAKELVATMKSSGWKTRVWNNTGWHYCIINQNLQVYPAYGRYFAQLAGPLDEGDTPCGSPAYWSINKSFDDPNEAARVVLHKARQFVAAVNDVVTKAEKALDL